jgi:DNA-binding transcriptional MerR regulator
MGALKIGQVANEAGVSVDTVRYYEKVGILPKPGRRDSGYRQFAPSTVERIRLVKHLQDLSLSLDDIMGMLDAVENADSATCRGESSRIEAALAKTESRIRALQVVRKRLRLALRHCHEGRCNLVERAQAVSARGRRPRLQSAS